MPELHFLSYAYSYEQGYECKSANDNCDRAVHKTAISKLFCF